MKAFKLAWRNLFRQKLRTLTTLLAVVLGLAGLVVFEGFIHQLMEAFRDSTILSGLGHVQISTSAQYWKDGEFSPYAYKLDHASKIEAQLKQDNRVLTVFPSTGFTAMATFGNHSASLLVKAFPSERMYFSPQATKKADASQMNPAKFYLGTLRAGQEPSPSQPGEIYLGATLARILQIKPGQVLTLMVLLPEGAVNGQDFKVRGIFSSAGFDQYYAYTDYPTALRFTQSQAPPVLHVLLKHRQDTDSFALATARAFPQFALKTWKQLAVYYLQVNGMFSTFLSVIQAIILIVTIFLLSNSLARSVLERQREWGTLRAMGSPARSIILLILTEGALWGLSGGVLGLALGFLLSSLLNLGGGVPFHNGPQLLSVQVHPDLLATGQTLIPLMLTGVLAALGPALHAVRQNPADSLRARN